MGTNLSKPPLIYILGSSLTIFAFWMTALGCFILLNFGKITLGELSLFLSLGSSALVGADLLVIVEFLLLVVALPMSVAFSIVVGGNHLVYPNHPNRLITLSFTLFAILSWALAFDVPLENSQDNHLQRSPNQPTQPNGLYEPGRTPTANVIHIFVESLSSDLISDGKESTRVQSALRLALGQNHVYSSIPANDIGGTIAGISSSLCGVDAGKEDFLNEESGHYLFSNLDCTSDVLAGSGYKNIFFGGASGEFQSKSKFLEEHEFRVFDRGTWLAIGAPEPFAWGQTIHDDRLFSHGRALAQGLLVEREPFFLMALTLDSHYPYYVPNSCEIGPEGISKMERSYLCSASSVISFISWFKSTTSDPTMIVIQGDTPPPMGISSSPDIFFAATCHGKLSGALEPPERIIEIAPFIVESVSTCE